ncbi:hypothetical protein [Dapis sp. BLCC M229]|uniref:hypothetical protein n=1 Tax=Dapis sp. BLCC M229 TaxID=3400188 RepID=UPI003CF76A6C
MAVAQPTGVIEKVIYPIVPEQTLQNLVKEYKSTGIGYRQIFSLLTSSESIAKLALI